MPIWTCTGTFDLCVEWDEWKFCIWDKVLSWPHCPTQLCCWMANIEYSESQLHYSVSSPMPNCSPGCNLRKVKSNFTWMDHQPPSLYSLVSGLCSEWDSIVEFYLCHPQSEVQPNATGTADVPCEPTQMGEMSCVKGESLSTCHSHTVRTLWPTDRKQASYKYIMDYACMCCMCVCVCQATHFNCENKISKGMLYSYCACMCKIWAYTGLINYTGVAGRMVSMTCHWRMVSTAV